MFLVEPDASFIEVVEDSTTLEKLKRESGCWTRKGTSTRVKQYLEGETSQLDHRLDKLAATTAGFLACSYLLGIRDRHGDNLMLTKEGELFRIDFGYLFGETPWVDAPTVWLPKTVCKALGVPRLKEVKRAAAVRTLLERPAEELCAICNVSVFDNAFKGAASAETYVMALSVENFQEEVRAVGSIGARKVAKSIFHGMAYNARCSRWFRAVSLALPLPPPSEEK